MQLFDVHCTSPIKMALYFGCHNVCNSDCIVGKLVATTPWGATCDCISPATRMYALRLMKATIFSSSHINPFTMHIAHAAILFCCCIARVFLSRYSNITCTGHKAHAAVSDSHWASR